MYDTVVVGGGIVGASVSYHLVQEGVDVLLLDRNDPGRATDAGAGIVSPATSGYEDPHRHRFRIEAGRYYSELIEDLERSVAETGFDRPGLLLVAGEEEQSDFVQTRDQILENQERVGYPPDGTIVAIDPGEASDWFPPLGHLRHALSYEDAGRVDGRVLNRALLQAAEANGLTTREASVDRVHTDDGSVTGVSADGEPIPAANVVVAGGAWSGSFADDLGVEIPVEPQRGQIVHLDVGTGAADWPIVKGFRDHYIVPWPDGGVAIGATREPDAGYAARSTAAGVRAVLDEALRLAPGLADAEFREVRVGLRPASADGRPVVGETPVRGAYLATGHGPSGLTLGPYSGKLVADLVLGRDVAADLSLYAPERFE